MMSGRPLISIVTRYLGETGMAGFIIVGCIFAMPVWLTLTAFNTLTCCVAFLFTSTLHAILAPNFAGADKPQER